MIPGTENSLGTGGAGSGPLWDIQLETPSGQQEIWFWKQHPRLPVETPSRPLGGLGVELLWVEMGNSSYSCSPQFQAVLCCFQAVLCCTQESPGALTLNAHFQACQQVVFQQVWSGVWQLHLYQDLGVSEEGCNRIILLRMFGCEWSRLSFNFTSITELLRAL